MSEKLLTPKTKQILVMAQQIAIEKNHSYISPDLIELALYRLRKVNPFYYNRDPEIERLEPISESLAESIAEEIYTSITYKDDGANSYLIIKEILLKRSAQPEVKPIPQPLVTRCFTAELIRLDEENEKLKSQLASKSQSHQGEEVYILLQEGDVIQEGDEYYSGESWNRSYARKNAGEGGGKVWKKDYPYRRKVRLNQSQWLTPKEINERVEQIARIFYTDDIIPESSNWPLIKQIMTENLQPPRPSEEEKVVGSTQAELDKQTEELRQSIKKTSRNLRPEASQPQAIEEDELLKKIAQEKRHYENYRNESCNKYCALKIVELIEILATRLKELEKRL